MSLLPARTRAQQADSVRELVERTPTPYPALARTTALQGSVKLEVLVSPDGTVKGTQIKGGHPVLAQAAVTPSAAGSGSSPLTNHTRPSK